MTAFAGCALPLPDRTATQMQGWRLDWQALGDNKDGVPGLQTAEGFFVGERGFERSQNAQGLRYRMRPTPEEYINNIETDGLLQQFGPLKFKFGEAFGGTGNNDKLRALKKKLAEEGLTDPVKIAENEYWVKRYGHKRWGAKYMDQSTGLGKTFFRGLAAWSGCDPLLEEKGKTWMPGTFRNPWLKPVGAVNMKLPEGQIEKEYNSGKLN